jgi:hypothetical protein
MDDLNHISQLKFDPKNARSRTPRSHGMIQQSLQMLGAARSITIDERNQIISGNGTVEAAGQVGIEKVKVIDVDGSTIVAVRRSNLTEDQKVQLAIADNRSSDLSKWDVQELEAIADSVDISAFFFDEELSKMINDAELERMGDGEDEGGDRGGSGGKEVNCECPSCGHKFIKILGS